MDSENKIRFYTLQCDLREQLRKVDMSEVRILEEKKRARKPVDFGFRISLEMNAKRKAFGEKPVGGTSKKPR